MYRAVLLALVKRPCRGLAGAQALSSQLHGHLLLYRDSYSIPYRYRTYRYSRVPNFLWNTQ